MRRIQKMAISKTSTFFVLSSWMLMKIINSWGNHFHKVSWEYNKNCGFFTNGQCLSVSHFFYSDFTKILLKFHNQMYSSASDIESWKHFQFFLFLFQSIVFCRRRPRSEPRWGYTSGTSGSFGPLFDLSGVWQCHNRQSVLKSGPWIC